MDNTLKIISISADIFGILTGVTAVIILFVSKFPEKEAKKYFSAMFISLLLALVSNMIGLILKGSVGSPTRVILSVANFCEYFFGYILAFILSLYFIRVTESGSRRKNLPWRVIFTFLFALSVILLVISQFNGMFYYLDDKGVYHRGNLFWISQVIAVVTLISDAIMVFINRKSMTKKELIAFYLYIGLPLLATILQLFFYGIYLMLLFSTLSTVCMMILIIYDQAEKYREKEAELAANELSLTESRNALVLSQIQPHFLYNALTSICRLCDTDPQKAKHALMDFTKYLRGNLDSIKQKKTISFSDELRHTQAYLSLEQIRYGEKLKVVYDISAADFFVPPLTVEPLAENAVNHGLSDKEDGGTVTISSRELDDGYVITVSDDGAGFNADDISGADFGDNLNDGKSHVGISAVKSRLEIMCGARLFIESEKGKGTTATIIIPKGEQSQ